MDVGIYAATAANILTTIVNLLSGVRGLDRDVIDLQDRKIKLLTAQVEELKADRETDQRAMDELKATVQTQAIMIARLEKERVQRHEHTSRG